MITGHPALLHLARLKLRGALRRQFRKLRSPSGLVFALVGLLISVGWIGSLLVGREAFAGEPTAPEVVRDWTRLGVGVFVFMSLLSAISVGYPVVIFESVVSARSFGRPVETPLLAGLGRIVPVFLGVYLFCKICDLTIRGAWPHVLAADLAAFAATTAEDDDDPDLAELDYALLGRPDARCVFAMVGGDVAWHATAEV